MALYLTKSRLVILVVVGVLVVLVAILFLLGLGRKVAPVSSEVKLEVWGIFQDRELMSKLVSAYQGSHNNVHIEYRNFGDAEFTDYEPTIVRTLAEGNGPDIFFINNTWLPRHIGKLVPAPQTLLSADDVRELFVEVVEKDFVFKDKKSGLEQVYGAPLALDTLALFYNREMLSSAGISGPPATWTEFLEDVKKLTVKDASGNIVRAGAAIGTSNNILRATDLLSLLMIQNGAEMTKPEDGRAVFTNTLNLSGKSVRPGPDALEFYAGFANPSSPGYTWHRREHFSVDAFYERRAAMMFGYSYNIETIRRKAPYLDFGVANMPQISTRAGETMNNYANYWAPVVTKKTLPGKYKEVGCTKGSVRPAIPTSPCWYAWDFLTTMLGYDNNKAYLEKMQAPAAQRALIDWQKADAGQRLAVFAAQGLTAKNWYQPDSRLTEQYLAEAIDAVQLRNMTPADALSEAAAQINALFARTVNE